MGVTGTACSSKGCKFSIPRVTTICNTSSKIPDALFWPPWGPGTLEMQTYTQAKHLYTYKKKKTQILKKANRQQTCLAIYFQFSWVPFELCTSQLAASLGPFTSFTFRCQAKHMHWFCPLLNAFLLACCVLSQKEFSQSLKEPVFHSHSILHLYEACIVISYHHPIHNTKVLIQETYFLWTVGSL